MTIDGVSGRTSYLSSQLVSIKSQLDTLTQQLSSGKKSTTYAGLGFDAATATGLRAQIASIASYANTATNLNTRINVVNLSLQGIADATSEVKAAAAGASLTLDNTGQTAGQQTAMASFTQTIALLNTTSAGRYLFSGRATDTPSTASADAILNGTTTQAGLRQLIDERKQADLGANGMGRVAVSSPTTTSVAISEDATQSPFGLKLDSISSTLTGATITAPPSPPPVAPAPPSSMSIDLGATNPNDGEKVKFTFTLPDGTSETISLTASTTVPTPEGSFAIGADSAATAANLNTALNTAIGKLANTSLVAASAVSAANNFFDSSPPLRVDGPPFDSATSLVNGTSTNTVSWYTGETGTDPARGTAVAGIDTAITVQYGARADEDAFRVALKNMAVYAAVTTSTSDPNATAQLTALNSRLVDNLGVQAGQQTIQDVQADFAGAQASIKTTTDRQKQAGAIAQTLLDSIQGIDDNEVAAKILALQTSLQASYQTTASLYQMSLIKFLPAG
ncbi:MAG: flagellar biosynthesis protein FlgL [Afipia sp.]